MKDVLCFFPGGCGHKYFPSIFSFFQPSIPSRSELLKISLHFLELLFSLHLLCVIYFSIPESMKLLASLKYGIDLVVIFWKNDEHSVLSGSTHLEMFFSEQRTVVPGYRAILITWCNSFN